jgi:alpha-galactosidase
MNKARYIPATAVALELTWELDSGGFPGAPAWNLAPPVRFAWDWQGENADLVRETEVRVLWNNAFLYLRFLCRYRSLTVFADSDAHGRRDQLWDRDVAEVFLQTDRSQPRRYWEFEISPNGMWVDLEISPDGKRDPASGMKSRVAVNEADKIWTAELVLPMAVLMAGFDPSQEWRVNFFRVEGATEPRFYSAWRPTYTPQPNFHVPEAFGILRFQKS